MCYEHVMQLGFSDWGYDMSRMLPFILETETDVKVFLTKFQV